MTERTCGSCAFLGGRATSVGVCRRYPPQVETTAHALFTWPTVLLNDWCGEYQPATEPVPTPEPEPPAPTPDPTVGAITTLYIADGGTKVPRHHVAISPALNRNYYLRGARNETVSCCIRLDAANEKAVGVSVKIESTDFPVNVGWNGDLANYVGHNVELFYVRYLPIKGLSTLAYEHYDERHTPAAFRLPPGGKVWKDRPHADAEYPEIAVPLELHPTFDIEAGTNQQIWLDIYIPKNLSSGDYKLSLTVTCQQQVITSDIYLHVDHFTLPDNPTALPFAYISRENVSNRYQGFRYPTVGDGAWDYLEEILDHYWRLAHRHGLALIDGYRYLNELEPWKERLTGRTFTLDRGYEGYGEGQGNGIFCIGAYGGWKYSGNAVGTLAQLDDCVKHWDWLQTVDPISTGFVYLSDESTNYAQTQRWAAHLEGSPLPTMATLPITKASLVPSLDFVCTTPGPVIASEWQAAVDSIEPHRRWAYNGWRPATGTWTTEDEPASLWMLGWTQFKHRFRRWFYWETTYYTNDEAGKQTDVFTNAMTFGELAPTRDVSLGLTGPNMNNGDGVLLYPGTDKVFPSSSYDVAIPFASLRLKHARRGWQDHMYLTLASKVDPIATRAIVDRMVPRVFGEMDANDHSDPTWVLGDISWPTDPDTWRDAREELAEIILKPKPSEG